MVLRNLKAFPRLNSFITTFSRSGSVVSVTQTSFVFENLHFLLPVPKQFNRHYLLYYTQEHHRNLQELTIASNQPKNWFK